MRRTMDILWSPDLRRIARSFRRLIGSDPTEWVLGTLGWLAGTCLINCRRRRFAFGPRTEPQQIRTPDHGTGSLQDHSSEISSAKRVYKGVQIFRKSHQSNSRIDFPSLDCEPPSVPPSRRIRLPSNSTNVLGTASVHDEPVHVARGCEDWGMLSQDVLNCAPPLVPPSQTCLLRPSPEPNSMSNTHTRTSSSSWSVTMSSCCGSRQWRLGNACAGSDSHFDVQWGEGTSRGLNILHAYV